MCPTVTEAQLQAQAARIADLEHRLRMPEHQVADEQHRREREACAAAEAQARLEGEIHRREEWRDAEFILDPTL